MTLEPINKPKYQLWKLEIVPHENNRQRKLCVKNGQLETVMFGYQNVNGPIYSQTLSLWAREDSKVTTVASTHLNSGFSSPRSQNPLQITNIQNLKINYYSKPKNIE